MVAAAASIAVAAEVVSIAEAVESAGKQRRPQLCHLCDTFTFKRCFEMPLPPTRYIPNGNDRLTEFNMGGINTQNNESKLLLISMYFLKTNILME